MKKRSFNLNGNIFQEFNCHSFEASALDFGGRYGKLQPIFRKTGKVASCLTCSDSIEIETGYTAPNMRKRTACLNLTVCRALKKIPFVSYVCYCKLYSESKLYLNA